MGSLEDVLKKMEVNIHFIILDEGRGGGLSVYTTLITYFFDDSR